MSKLSMRGSGTVASVAHIIEDGIYKSGISCELVDRADRAFSDGTRATMLVFEKYYWRAGNRASLSVMITGKNNTVNVDAVGSGGGTGIFFSFSWGAEDSFTAKLEKILTEYCFKTI